MYETNDIMDTPASHKLEITLEAAPRLDYYPFNSVNYNYLECYW